MNIPWYFNFTDKTFFEKIKKYNELPTHDGRNGR